MPEIKRPGQVITKMNPMIWFLTFNDVFTWGPRLAALSLVGLYISEKLGMDAIEVVGIGTGITFLARGIIQIPIGIVADKIKGNNDEYKFLFLGNVLMGLSFVLLIGITTATEFYLLQAMAGVGAALNLVDWRKLFAANLDKGREGTEYGAYETVMSLSIALMSVVSGYFAALDPSYFDLVMFTIGLMMIGSNVWLLPMYLRGRTKSTNRGRR